MKVSRFKINTVAIENVPGGGKERVLEIINSNNPSKWFTLVDLITKEGLVLGDPPCMCPGDVEEIKKVFGAWAKG